MRTSSKALFAAALAAVAVGVAAQDRPESILPPGFGDPAPAPRPTASSTAATLPRDPVGAVVQPLPSDTPSPVPTPSASPPPVDAKTLAAYELPTYARRSTSLVGVGDEVGADAFGRADGGYIEALMRRVAAPLPSRWLSIALRRTLAAHLDTPASLNGADYAAERAWLLLRMGESVAARAVVEGVDNADYTPKLYQVAMNAMLANGDPAGLCPLADAGWAVTREGGWRLAQPICASLAGNMAQARTSFAAARRGRSANDIDLRLTQKVMGTGGQGRQAVTIEWDGVDRLSAWRFGLATATGVAVPAVLFDSVGPQTLYWQALAPAVSPSDRLVAAEAAAAQGVLSNVALVDLYGAIAADENASSSASASAEDLRTAYADRDPAARMAALRQLWGADGSYARMVLTARAAARQPVAADNADAGKLIASMLSAGLDRTAARWTRAAPAGSDAWAMLALSDPDGRRRFTLGDIQNYRGEGQTELKRRLFFAGVAGLELMNAEEIGQAAQDLGVRIGAADVWTRALDRAVAEEQPGTVVLLAAIGMQTAGWRGVPPGSLYRIVAALRAVGLTGEARMIAAEAIARL